MRVFRALLAAVVTVAPSLAWAAAGCNKVAPPRPVSLPMWLSGAAVGFDAPGLSITANGAPNAYRPDGRGLSDLCEGSFAMVNNQPKTSLTDPQHWLQECRAAWVKAAESHDYSEIGLTSMVGDFKGGPKLQGEKDPLPGQAYLSTTIMQIPSARTGTQRSYVDATEIPYVTLPSAAPGLFGISLGDVAAVYRPRTGAVAFGVYADCCLLGKASVRLHRDLGNDPIVERGEVQRADRPIADKVVVVVFPGHGAPASADAEAWRAEIRRVGEAALNAWGGLARLKTCAA
ncbi:MAG: hypothetical protein NVSMB18_07790 [Acetobacteraceae bacterium]